MTSSGLRTGATTATATAEIEARGPYDLAEVALMGFGHRDERSFDGVMRLAFCLDGDLETQVGVEVRQDGQRVVLALHPSGPELSAEQLDVATAQVARVISLDHDGAAFDRLCLADPVLARLHAVAPGFRPALFYSPYEAAVWSVISARRARPQAISLRQRLCEQHGHPFDLAGVPTAALPTPSALLALESFPGLPADRVPRLHAVAEAAREGRLEAERLRALPPDEASRELQQLPGVGPFYASLILLRASGHADLLPEESHARAAVQELYGVEHELGGAELERLAEGWRPFRTWVMVTARALGGRLEG
jgi:DNA-3-methyladenine glycosylase II